MILVGCAEKPPLNGEITDKKYSAGYSYVTFMSCGTNCNMPVTNWVNDEYILYISGCDPECRTVGVDVDPNTFNTMNVGDDWPKKSNG